MDIIINVHFEGDVQKHSKYKYSYNSANVCIQEFCRPFCCYSLIVEVEFTSDSSNSIITTVIIEIHFSLFFWNL